MADLLRGFLYCFTPGNRHEICHQIAEDWQADDALVCLSVRSGFDLLLHSTNWPVGSQIIMSGLTIPDMPRIVQANGMVPVGVDIDPFTMRPMIDQIRDAITPDTRAIVVAHLLGGLCDISEIIELAVEHNLLVIEDCAQAYVGTGYQGDSRADISMFSFGPIKTNTALAGGVFRVRQKELRHRMARLQDQWKIQSRFAFAKRTAKYAFVKSISTRPMCGGFYRIMKLFGKNHDGVASTMARGFAGPGFFRKIRQQPSIPLLKLLRRKLDTFQESTTNQRQSMGQLLVRNVAPDVHVLGSQMHRQTYWVLPLLVEQPDELVRQLWESGFDASNNCSLHSVVKDEVHSNAAEILKHIVFLPLSSNMPESELQRMAGIIKNAKPAIPAFVSDKFESSSNSVPSPSVPSPHFSHHSGVVSQS